MVRNSAGSLYTGEPLGNYMHSFLSIDAICSESDFTLVVTKSILGRWRSVESRSSPWLLLQTIPPHYWTCYWMNAKRISMLRDTGHCRHRPSLKLFSVSETQWLSPLPDGLSLPRLSITRGCRVSPLRRLSHRRPPRCCVSLLYCPPGFLSRLPLSDTIAE
jgi:hypothetical protein